ncbi:MAG: response regulator, partial [Gemmatimonadota bacterium]|nr:response regulator [Gemmatimonadota bacterium]
GKRRKPQQDARGAGGGGAADRKKKGGTQDRQPKAQQTKANMVILIDDDPAYVEMESLAVVHYITGCNPMGFTSPSRALNYVTNPRNASRIRLVLLDLEMPRVDGHTVQEILQVLKQSRNIPVAIVSAYNTAENIERVRDLGAVGFLPKAFTMEVFVRFIKDLIRQGYVNSWQCTACGKLVSPAKVDMLNMRPIKCSDAACGSPDIRKVSFTPRPGTKEKPQGA